MFHLNYTELTLRNTRSFSKLTQIILFFTPFPLSKTHPSGGDFYYSCFKYFKSSKVKDQGQRSPGGKLQTTVYVGSLGYCSPHHTVSSKPPLHL